MEALNATSLTPLSVLCEKRSEPRRISSLPTISASKLSSSATFNRTSPTLQDCLSRSLHGGLALLSSVFAGDFAQALTYEEGLQPLTGSSRSEVESSGVLDTVVGFVTENPAIVASGAAILAVPIVLSQVFGKSKPWGSESPKSAYAKLGEDAGAQLLDIRGPKEFREVGSPDVRGLGKKPVSIVYKSEEKPRFLKKLSLKFKKPENTTLFILDNPEPANVQKAEPAQLTTEPKVEAAAERSPQINSVAKTEAKAESVPGFPRPLSPYPYYPDLKPPTSPSPSQP
ncbi:hypothetical protein SLEP1_g9897 [Rubroshorea leprosula]|uniref:Uncharacterized protein n=1 Tax=Rubroshorea leprosula TaxID=152421 RepID=A0AAV5IAW3_9ROSI|nr:hypothetical protein SLEP1_g9897 [Rubroshorea leprosula]